MQKFSGEGDTPSPDPIPLGAYGVSNFAPTALKLNVTPPEKNPSYGHGSYKHKSGNLFVTHCNLEF